MFAPDFWGHFKDQHQGLDHRGTPFPPCTLGVLCNGGEDAATGLPCTDGCLKTVNLNLATHTQTRAVN